MRKPPRKYFTCAGEPESLMQIRKWINRGVKPLEIARWITDEYRKTSDEDVRRQLGMMLCSVYDTRESQETGDVAQRCASMFNLNLLKRRTIAESALSETINIKGMENFKWLKQFNSRLAEEGKLKPSSHLFKKVSSAISIKDFDNLFPIDEERLIYAMRANDGSFRLVIFVTDHKTTLIDEESFNDEPPLYFTESSHYISPVWYIKKASYILGFILDSIGYPPMRIYRDVIYTSPEAELINYDNYFQSDDWDNVNVVTRRNSKCTSLLQHTTPLLREDVQESQLEIDSALILSLVATSKIIETIDFDSHDELTYKKLNGHSIRLKLFLYKP